MIRPFLLLLLLAVPRVGYPQPVPPPGDELLLERTFMPDAAPSSFAIGFPGGINFCYDPVRGGLSYIWSGGFVDLSAVRPGQGKSVKAVPLLGPVVYRERGQFPLRPGDAARQPVVVLTGYHLGDDAVEFRYTVDGAVVREEIRPRAGGSGLTRRFRIEAPAGTWWYLPGSREGGELTAPSGQPDAGGFRFEKSVAREFVVEVTWTKAGV